ncbi:hypothetical protein ACE102_17525 [Bradyrhizobium sp. vgs-9]|uniref:hypothetical protein n=1 Tax=Bradyrhizobium sp. vgs-9 TaxID=208389 RepID=UPI0035D3F279
MTALSSYSTGTVSVAEDGTTVTGTSTIWLTAGNVKPGDLFQSGHFVAKITDVTDDTHLVILPWPGSTLSGATYAIWKESQQRIVGETYARDVDKIVSAWNTSGFFVFVDIAETVPDPSLGDDGQYAFQPTTGKTWAKVAGVWSYLGIYKAFQLKGAWSGATAYAANDVVTLSGSSYVCVLDHTNHTPPNATYWQLLASKGDTGATGSTGAAGTNAPTYGGTSTTSLAIGTGSKVFTTQAGLAYNNGARVRASSGANWLEGVATYSGTTLTITSDKTNGSGTFASWTFNVAGQPGAGDLSSANNLSDVANVATARANLGAGTVNSVTAGTGLSGGTITSSGTIALALNNATLQAAPSNPAGVASFVMLGLGSTCHITPIYSTRILVTISGHASNGGAGTFTNLTIRYGTGTAPANGASPTGTTATTPMSVASSTNLTPFSLTTIITGLTAGVAYWLDLSASPLSGTSSLGGINCTAVEL